MTLEIVMKTCSGCKVDRPVAEFSKDKRCSSGFGGCCKICSNARSAEFRKNNPEKHASRQRAWRHANREKAASISKKWEKSNRTKISAARAKWRKENSEVVAAATDRARKIAKATLSDGHIKKLLCDNNGIPHKQIPQSLVELKRIQIQISNFLKEQSK